ncbi:hypothetical protein FEM48_Zijuj07G0102400 [Ziziphus jujuba var. spinosa]|uniref:Uncharacterized protein n=1 Tax=Ziziphus jujuba var. spinosa TaxID=714518 RepID=A0A978V421_ZIZJJ|nr:hypothetical protein FEM48_Zijuj07G0102400 [Ziziphus jujuba var. spinosa]
MDSTVFYSPTSDLSPESSLGSQESFSWDSFNSNSINYLPFNENDSEEMLLYGLLSNTKHQEMVSDNHPIKEEEEGCSPVVALKRKHSMRRKIVNKNKHKERDLRIENTVVFEDLGADYLEELLNSSESSARPCDFTVTVEECHAAYTVFQMAFSL